MNSVEPMNCTRSMSGLCSGMARLRPRPAKNAPTMPSIPAASASTAADEKRRDAEDEPVGAVGPDAGEEPARHAGSAEQRPDAEHGETDGDPQQLQAQGYRSACRRPRPPTSTSSAEVSVTAVAPTTVATARLRASPICRSIG